jgi:DcmR-like sensory protein
LATAVNTFSHENTRSQYRPDEAHVVQFYTSDAVLLNGLGASLGAALKVGESVVAVMTKAHLRALLKRFSAQALDTAELIKNGRLTVLDASDALTIFMDARGPDRQRFLSAFGAVIRKATAAAETKGKRVVVFGEMVAVLWERKKFDSAIRLEQLWNELARTQFFALRCAYPAKGFRGMKGEPYATICGEHSVVIPA